MSDTKSYIEKSADAFGIDPNTLEPLVGNSGAAVFKGDSKTGPKVLKINSPRFDGKQSVIEGLHYQEGLAKQMTGDVALAGPLRSQSGELGEEIDTDDGLRIAMAFEFVPGKEVRHRIDGYQIPINDPAVGGLLYERMGRPRASCTGTHRNTPSGGPRPMQITLPHRFQAGKIGKAPD